MFKWLSLLYVMLVAVGLIQYELWGQVEYVRSLNLTLQELEFNAHLTRYLLVLPVYSLSEISGVSANLLFSVFCSVMVIGVAVNLSRINGLLTGKQGKYKAFILLFFIVLSLFMHGRIVFALFALSVLMRAVVAWEEGAGRGSFLVVLFSLWLASVSSGTFVIIYLVTLFWLAKVSLKFFYGQNCLSPLWLLLKLFVVLVSVLPLLMIFLEKNTSYFGGIWPMLKHGAGKVIVDMPMDMLLLIGGNVLAVGILFFIGLRGTGKYQFLCVTFVVGACGGIFGYSTLVMTLPPMILLVLKTLDMIGETYSSESEAKVSNDKASVR